MQMYEERSKVIMLIVIVVAVLFTARLFYLQVIDREYKQFAEDNALRKETLYPARGLIYDRKGKILVRNETIYDVMVVPSKVKPFDTAGLCALLEIDTSDFRAEFRKAKSYSRYKPSPVVRQITRAQYGRFQERLFEFRGFYVESRTTRSYPLSLAAHAIGYLGEVNTDEIGSKEGYYKMGDYIGKSGLEKSYEEQLRGQKGVRIVMVDVLNREQGRYQNGKYDIPSIPGKDLMTGLDLKLQEFGEYLLKDKTGSIVAIDPRTGEILAMISSPSYDPNLLLGRNRASNYGKLLLDPKKPMFNRAISAKYPPGSTLKTVEAVLGLSEHVITPSYTYTCSGGYHLSASQTIHCHASGTYDVRGSIQMSCNAYYCNVFRLLVDEPRLGNPVAGLENWAKGLNKFGLGQKLGLDIPNESKGIIPSPAYYDRFYGKNGWKSSTIISLGIGQAEISLTPLQLANQAATLANRGYYYIPHFVRSIQDKTTNRELHWRRVDTGIDTSYFNVVVDAMQAVVEHGTAIFSRIPGIEFCGKTGTAQNPHGDDHSIFIGFAPKVNPVIAIAVVVENAGQGAHMAAPIASVMIEKYLTDTVKRGYVMQRIFNTQPAPKKTDEKNPKPAGSKPDVKTEEEGD